MMDIQNNILSEIIALKISPAKGLITLKNTV